MAVEADIVYRDQLTIVDEMVAAWQSRVDDFEVSPDSVLRLAIEVWANTIEGLYLANQVLHNDMFIQTAQPLALERAGEMYGRPRKTGVAAAGTLLVSGNGGVVVPTGAIFSAPQASDEALDFVTTTDGTIPNPGIPTAPTVADGGAGNINALVEYGVTFTTTQGETVLGAISAPLQLTNRQANLTNIPLGGPGTVGRKVYRRDNGGGWRLVTTIANNTVTIYTDDTATPPLQEPLTTSTAERIAITAQADDIGTAYNVVIGMITEVSDAPPGVTGVTNTTTFAGGTEEEDTEGFRADLLEHVRNPQTGSGEDLKSWAEAIDGIEEATVFKNDNLGTPQNGHTTIRVAGPGGSTPSGDKQNEVLLDLISRDHANATLHVATFTAVAQNVTVDVTLESGYVLADVTPSVQAAIVSYILSVPVGGTVRAAGVIDAVFGLPGIANVTTTYTDQAIAATSKATAGTISVI